MAAESNVRLVVSTIKAAAIINAGLFKHLFIIDSLRSENFLISLEVVGAIKRPGSCTRCAD